MAGILKQTQYSHTTPPHNLTLGIMYITDANRHRITKRWADTASVGIAVFSLIAGNGVPGFSGDGGDATQASLYSPSGIDVDAQGNIFFADTYNNLVRVITPVGKIYTAAGTGQTWSWGMGSYGGDGGPSTEAGLSYPTDVRVDADGNLLIADANNHRIRKVSFER